MYLYLLCLLRSIIIQRAPYLKKTFNIFALVELYGERTSKDSNLSMWVMVILIGEVYVQLWTTIVDKLMVTIMWVINYCPLKLYHLSSQKFIWLNNSYHFLYKSNCKLKTINFTLFFLSNFVCDNCSIWTQWTSKPDSTSVTINSSQNIYTTYLAFRSRWHLAWSVH